MPLLFERIRGPMSVGVTFAYYGGPKWRPLSDVATAAEAGSLRHFLHKGASHFVILPIQFSLAVSSSPNPHFEIPILFIISAQACFESHTL